ncbi:lipopolysaccharide biosynthesis protein [Pseudomonas anuradhapurensis]
MKRDLIKVFIGENLSKAILLAVNLLLISMMSVSEYAQFTLLFSLTMLGTQLACAATERLYIVDHENFAPFARQALFGSLSLCLVAVLVYLHGMVSLLENAIVCGAMLILSLQQFRRITYQQRQYFGFYVVADLLKSTIWLVSVVTLFYIVGQLTAAVALTLLVFASIAGLLCMPKVPPEDLAIRQYRLRDLFSAIAGNFEVYSYTLLAAVLPYMAVLLVSQSENDVLVATYGAAMRFQAVTASVIQVLNVVILPKISTAVSSGQGPKFLKSSHKKIPIMSAIIFLVTLIVSLAMPYVDGGKYPDAPHIFIVLSGCSWMSLISVASVNYLLARHAYRQILIAMIAGLLVIVISSIFLQLYFQKYGIAYAALSGYVVIASFIFVAAKRKSILDVSAEQRAI